MTKDDIIDNFSEDIIFQIDRITKLESEVKKFKQENLELKNSKSTLEVFTLIFGIISFAAILYFIRHI